MRGFARRWTVREALTWLDAQLQVLDAESVPLESAGRRVLARPVASLVDVPGFARAMMDGFAVRAADTSGASPYNPLLLSILGESLPGRGFLGDVADRQAVRIMTGAPMPRGADAVLPVEWTAVADDRVRVEGEVSPGRHVGRRGEDVAAGDQVLPAGRRLRPQDLGLLSSIGAACVDVVRRPQVRLAATGDELLPPGASPQGHRIADANTPMLAALVERDGGVVERRGLVPDDPDAILASLQADVQVVLVSGGSSVGQEDHAPHVLAEQGELAVHGVAMRPSSPTGMGRLGDRLVFLLPGNPVSCLCAYDFFAGRAIRALAGLSRDWPYRCSRVRLASKLVSVAGRVDYARVRREGDEAAPLAIRGASILSSTTRADGFVVIPHDSEGYPSGSEVSVYWYD